MNQKNREAEMKYRLAVIVLDSIRDAGLLKGNEYDRIRRSLAAEFDAPIGMLEAEDELWKIQLP